MNRNKLSSDDGSITDVWERKIRQIIIAGRLQNNCIKSSTLPTDDLFKYYEEEAKRFDKEKVLRPINENVEQSMLGKVYGKSDAERGIDTVDAPSGKDKKDDGSQLTRFHEVSTGDDGTYLFIAVEKTNPLYDTLKTAKLRRKDFDDSALYAFGIIAIILGISAVITGIGKVVIMAWFYQVGTGIWCGCFLIIAGALSIAASYNVAERTSNGPIIAALVFGCVAIFGGIFMVILSIIAITYDYTDTTQNNLSVTTNKEAAIALHIIDIAIGIGGAIVAFTIAFCTGKYVWRKQHYSLVPTSKLGKPSVREFSDVSPRPSTKFIDSNGASRNNGYTDVDPKPSTKFIDAGTTNIYPNITTISNGHIDSAEHRYRKPPPEEEMVGTDEIDYPLSVAQPNIPKPPTVHVDPPRAVRITHRESQAGIMDDNVPLRNHHRRRHKRGRVAPGPDPESSTSDV
ncbi:uncharacterized protein LOC141899897 [Tubulanus polymorphus]|uniref:uncharacterized protein LOC141899897 n=1 Tax=Tubulanus polymorphus TaxID=672921 RepID=UPI003DA1D618